MNRVKNVITVLLLVIAFDTSSLTTVAAAENCAAKEYMAEGIRAVYNNMNVIYKAYYDDEGKLETQSAGFVAIWQEWDDDGNLLSRTYLDEKCQLINRADGYAKAIWTQDENGTWNVGFYDLEGKSVPIDGLNLARDVPVGKDGWSDWMKEQIRNAMFFHRIC